VSAGEWTEGEGDGSSERGVRGATMGRRERSSDGSATILSSVA